LKNVNTKYFQPNEPVEKVNFLKSVPSAGSKIRNDHPLSLKLFALLDAMFLFP